MPTLDEQIQLRAYHIWENEGRPFGRDQEHWLKAAAELATVPALKTKAAAKTASAPTVTGKAKAAKPAKVASATKPAKAPGKPKKA